MAANTSHGGAHSGSHGALRHACSISPRTRTSENLDAINEFVRDVLFWPRLPEHHQHALCKEVALVECARAENVLRKVGRRTTFVVLTGSAGVQLVNEGERCPRGEHKPEQCDCADRKGRPILILCSGCVFGEGFWPFIESPAQFIVTADTTTEVLVFGAQSFQSYGAGPYRQTMLERVQFLRSIPGFSQALHNSSLSLIDLCVFASILTEERQRGNTLILRQGEPADKLLFIRSGSVLLLRVVPKQRSSPRFQRSRSKTVGVGTKLSVDSSLFEIMVELRRRERRAAEEKAMKKKKRSSVMGQLLEQIGGSPVKRATLQKPSPQRIAAYWAMVRHIVHKSFNVRDAMRVSERLAKAGLDGAAENRKPDQLLLSVGVLGPHQYFGVEELRDMSPYALSLMSQTSTELFVLSRVEMLRQLPKKLGAEVLAPLVQSDLLPCDSDLVSIMKESQRWDAYRRNIRKDVRSRRDGGCPLGGGGIPAWLLSSSTSACVAEVDIVANMKFLGLRPNKRMLSPSKTSALATQLSVLTMQEEEHWSEAPASVRRRLRDLLHDPYIQKALPSLNQVGDRSGILTKDAEDEIEHVHPISACREQQWIRAHANNDPFNVNWLDDLLKVDEEQLKGPAPEATHRGRTKRHSALQATTLSKMGTQLPALSGEASGPFSARTPRSEVRQYVSTWANRRLHPAVQLLPGASPRRRLRLI